MIDIDAVSQDNFRRTALMLAAEQGFLHCVQALVQAKANLHILDAQQKSCIDLCSIEKGRGCLRTLKNGLRKSKSLKSIQSIKKN